MVINISINKTLDDSVIVMFKKIFTSYKEKKFLLIKVNAHK